MKEFNINNIKGDQNKGNWLYDDNEMDVINK